MLVTGGTGGGFKPSSQLTASANVTTNAAKKLLQWRRKEKSDDARSEDACSKGALKGDIVVPLKNRVMYGELT
jgi:hypothetical protein